MKHLQKMQLIMALVAAINEAGIAEMVCHLSGYRNGNSSLNVYGWDPAPGEKYTTENKIYDKDAFLPSEEAPEQLATIISDLQGMLTNAEAAA
ncbi:hypothetical protein GCM10023116_46480 [Kistimonas scapharcae]|uniref:Uncharacterized protein n=1 Tax=Kistimonas scapharcae TaxID=1036133 RepID=A0ABP8VAD2_9GAMM